MKTTYTSEAVAEALDAIYQTIADHGTEIRLLEERAEKLKTWDRYSTCLKCEAEMVGGLENLRTTAEACSIINRTDIPCAFCDTQEQQKELADAMERVD